MNLTEAQKRAFARELIEILVDHQAQLTAAGFTTATRITQLQTLAQAADDKEAGQVAAREAHRRATTESKAATKAAYDNASATIELIVGLLGKSDPLVKTLKNLRDEMSNEAARGRRSGGGTP